MSIRALLFVDPPRPGQATFDPWVQALFLPLGCEPALARYCRIVARHCRPTSLILSESLTRLLPPQALNRVILHTYRNSFADGTFARSRAGSGTAETLLIDAGRLAWIDIDSVLSVHRDSGAGMSVFCGPAQREYCCERIASDASGIVRGAVRCYSDSSRQACQANPVAIILSRRTFRPDPATPISSFAELADHLKERVRRAGDRTQCIRHPAVRTHANPMDALLGLVERSQALLSEQPCATGGLSASEDTGRQAARGTRDAYHAVQIRGPIEIGRGVSIGPGALIIGPAVLGEAVEIGPGAVVSRSIVLPGATVPENGHCHNQVIGSGLEAWDDSRDPDLVPNDLDDDEAIVPGRSGDRLRRLIDFFAAVSGLLLLAPLFALVAAAVKLSSPGPVFFRHRRQGHGGAEFECLKFRTMVRDADALQQQLRECNQVDGPQFKISEDPRVTRVGRWLRRSNIDELPQLINVLRGEMSLVGPRPSPDRENQYCPTWRRLRLSVRPGITGLWQVARSPDRHLTDFQEWIYYDTRYVENRSLRLDLQIIWQTVRVLFRLGPSQRWLSRWRPQPSRWPADSRFALAVDQPNSHLIPVGRG
jgi:lipopolysaccharide/colanic/teichoic acid biosynthesis glycosyltransferase